MDERRSSDPAFLEEKRSVRRAALAQRKSLSAADNRAASERICTHLVELPEIAAAHTVHTYVGGLPGEVDTLPFIRWLLTENRTVLVPIVDVSTHTMSAVRLLSMDQLHPTRWGGLEPVDAEPADAFSAEVIVVPGVLFDRAGHRLGMGGGFYDEFLRGSNAPKIAVAHGFQIVDRVPVDNRDERVDCIVTDEEVIRVG